MEGEDFWMAIDDRAAISYDKEVNSIESGVQKITGKTASTAE